MQQEARRLTGTTFAFTEPFSAHCRQGSKAIAGEPVAAPRLGGAKLFLRLFSSHDTQRVTPTA
jgi:hypothetical protein